jgi:hypothetical protein
MEITKVNMNLSATKDDSRSTEDIFKNDMDTLSRALCHLPMLGDGRGPLPRGIRKTNNCAAELRGLNLSLRYESTKLNRTSSLQLRNERESRLAGSHCMLS